MMAAPFSDRIARSSLDGFSKCSNGEYWNQSEITDKLAGIYTILNVVSLWVLGLPVPQIPAHVLERARRAEPELLLRQRRVRGQVRHVTRPASDNLGLKLETGGLLHCLNHLEDGQALALAEVVGLVLAAVAAKAGLLGVGRGREGLLAVQRLERVDVALGKVDNCRMGGGDMSAPCLGQAPHAARWRSG